LKAAAANLFNADGIVDSEVGLKVLEGVRSFLRIRYSGRECDK